ncbi:MAG: GEVED domain-containing protein, partial [Bacteroidetes bacterium]|nr:GEVED domain-containing protein [Bacteroidota bacterium]
MKKVLLFVFAVMMISFLSAQTIIFQEGFESTSIGLTTTADSGGYATTNFKAWAASTNLYKSGVKSDTNTLQPGKTIYLTSNSFATTGNNFVILEFAQICKLYFSDGGNIEVSIDNGTTWTSLGTTQYLGSGVLISSGGLYKFSESAYPADWLAGDTLTKPTNTWWKNEKFDISSIAANQPNVKIRFKYTSSGNPAGAGRYGWLLDDIKVTVSPSELYPPVITMLSYPTDTTYYGGPYNVTAFVKDGSGLDTVYIMYKVGNGAFTQLGMTKSPLVDSLYSAAIPFPGYWKWVTYNVIARDASVAHNMAYKPATGYYTFFPKYNAGGGVIVGTGTTNQNYPFKANADYTKSASLYLATNINKFGLITSLAWNVSTAQPTTTIPIRIYIKQTTSTVMTADSWANLINGATLVYDGTQIFSATGWKTIALTTPFSYNSGNLLVLCEANNGVAASVTPSFYYTSGTTGTHQYFASSASTTGTLAATRPNITINFLANPFPTPDAGISQIVYPTGSVLAGTAFNFDVKIKNFTNDSLKKAKVWYVVDGGTPANTTWQGLLLKDSTYTYTAVNLNLAVGIHNVKVWTDLPNDSADMNFQNDTLSYSFYACSAPLSGTYTVGGTGANFPTFSDVLVGLTQCGINGPVVFNVNPGTYSDQLTIPEIVGATAINTITFKAANNDSTSVIMNHTSISASNWIVKLNGADYITFKNIKFAPVDPNYSAAVVLTAGATYNQFIGNYFAGYSGTAVSQTSISIEGTNLVNKNNLIKGNYFYQSAYAISAKGLSTAILKNTVIKNNIINNSMSYGIYVQYVDSCLIDSNTVNSSIVNTGNKYGIYATNANILNRITRNTVILTAGTNMYGILVENSVSTDTTKGLIANNFVSLQNGTGYAYGIRLLADTKYKVYANSVFVTGVNTTDTRGINITGTSAFIEVLNNNSQSNVYPHFYEASSVSISNYNNYYSTTNLYGYYTTVFVNFTSLPALVAAYLKDSNSISVNPFFLSTTDLHTYNGLLKGMGTNLTDVTTDIDGNPRLNPPCIGADEFLPPAQDATLSSILKPIGGCGLTSTEEIKVVIKNVGSANILPNTMTARYKIDSLNAVVSELVNRTINVGDTIQYTFTAKANLAVNPLTLNDTTFKLKAWVDLTGDYAHANDSSALFSFSSMFTPPPPTATGATVFYSSTATLTAVSPKPLVWYKTLTSPTILGTGPSFTTPVLLATDTFYVAAKTSQSSVGYVGEIAPLSTAGTGGGIGTYLNFTALSNTTLISVDMFPYGTGAGTVTIALQTSAGVAITSVTVNCTGTTSPLSPAQTAVLNFPLTAGTSYRLSATAWTGGVTNLYRDLTGTYPYTLPGVLSITSPSLTPYYYFWYHWKVGTIVEGCVSNRVPVIATVLSYAHEAGLSKIIAPTGCGLYQVPISVKIFNHSYIDTLKSSNCTVKYKLDNGSFITPEAINLVIKPFDTATYTFTALANFTAPVGDHYFKVTAVVNTPGDAYSANDTLIKDSILSRYTPPSPITNNISVFNGSQATLTATAPGTFINWYDTIVGGTKIGQGSPFTTPFFMYVSDTFYVEANTSFLAAGILGTGTVQNTTTGYPSPYGQFYTGSREQYLITKAELNAMGFQAGPINSVGFDMVSYTGQAMTNYAIMIGHTTLTNMTTSFVSGLTQVYTIASLMPTVGWNIYPFTTPFVWNGNDNIVIENCFDMYAGSSNYTYNAIVNQSATSFVSALNHHSDGGGVCPISVSSYTPYSQRPNMKLEGMVPGCGSARVPVIVTVSPPPINDAGITTLVNPVGNTPSGVSTPIKVKIKNYGQANLTSATVQWTLNGVQKPNYSFTGNIPSGSDSTITIANQIFAGGLYCVKAWTKNPNGAPIDSTASNDTLHSVCFTACLNGTYTIGDTTNGNFHNFPNFTSAIANLTVAGVCGAVTFLVDTGTFNEQVRISQINGASASNTITFRSQSNDSTKVILQYAAPTSTNYYTLRLDSAKYVTFKGMTIKSTGVTYGRPVESLNTSTNNTISNCVLEMPVSTSSGFNGIYDYGTASCFNTYQYNRIVNGYYGIYLYGSSTTSLKPATRLIGNKVLNFYYYGLYSWYQDSIQIIGNEFNSNTPSTYVYAMYMGYNQNAIKILKNKVILTNAGTQYAMYVYYCTATAAAPGLIANNMIALSNGTTSSTNYGLYPYYSNYQNFYYNSVSVAVPTPTNGRALYDYYGSFHNYLNNSFVNTGGGFAYYVGSTTAVVQSDYNNIYTTGPVLGYWNANTNTLADLKLASTKDNYSVSVDPTYTSATDLHLLSTTLSTLATPIPGITDDIDGFTRDAVHPTIGADEVPLLPYDAGVTFISRPSSTELEGATFPVKVAVKNFGTSPITSVLVTYVFNGGAPVNYTYTPTVPIASLATDSVTFPSSITVPAGNNTICAYTTLTGDINTFNNSTCKNFWGAPLYDAQLGTLLPMQEGCGLTLDTVKILIFNQGVMPISGGLTASYQKLGGTAVVTETITTPIPVGGNITYTFNTLCNVSVTNADSVFKIKSWVTLTNDNMPLNNLDTIFVSSLHTPLNPTTSNVTIPYATTATLTANSSTNDPLKWYDVPVAGTSLYTGSPYLTPILFATTTYYVEANSSYSASGVIGNGTVQNTTTGYPSPYGQFYNGSREQYLITKAELNALGIQAGPITSLGFDVVSYTGTALSNYTLKIAHTSLSALTTTFATGLTQVYSTASYVPVTGWNIYTFTTPFVWNGIDNLLVEDCFDNYPNGYTYNAIVNQTTTSFISTLNYHSDGGGVCPYATGTTYSQRPNMKIQGMIPGCSSARLPAIVTVGAQPLKDASGISVVSPVTAVNLTANETVKVLVKNYGSTPIYNFPVKYKLTHGTTTYPVVAQNMTDTIYTDSTKVFTFTQTVNLNSNNQPDTFKLVAWTDMVGDPTHQNDTTKSTVINMPPVYCISSALYAADEDIGQLIFAGISHGSATPIMSNTTATQLYTNYSDSVNLRPVIQPGLTYPVSVSVIYSGTYAYTGYCKVFIDYNRNGTWELPYEIAWEGPYDGTTISTMLGNVTVPYTALPGLTKMRIVLQESGSTTTVLPCGTYGYGETEDYTVNIIPPIPHDAGMNRIATGTFFPYTATSSQTPYFFIRNYGSDSLTTATIKYTVNGVAGPSSPYTWTPTAPLTSLYSLAIDSVSLAVNLSDGLNKIISFTTGVVGDTNYKNDTVKINVFKEHLASVPYFDNFETNSYWFATDTSNGLQINNLWAQGVPTSSHPSMNAAHSPVKVWATKLSGDYPASNLSVLYSPVFDISIMQPDTLKFWQWRQFATGTAGFIEYKNSVGDWIKLGKQNDTSATNWYNDTTHTFRGVDTVWKLST